MKFPSYLSRIFQYYSLHQYSSNIMQSSSGQTPTAVWLLDVSTCGRLRPLRLPPRHPVADARFGEDVGGVVRVIAQLAADLLRRGAAASRRSSSCR